MVVLRGTKKVLRYLPAVGDSAVESTTALGDWFANRIVLGRQPVLLLVSSKSLLAALVPARDVKSIPNRLAEIVANRLDRLGVEKRIVQAEVSAMDSVVVAKTNNRSVLGTMNDFAHLIPHYLGELVLNHASLEQIEAKLEKTPCGVGNSASECIWPDRKAGELLWEKWSAVN